MNIRVLAAAAAMLMSGFGSVQAAHHMHGKAADEVMVSNAYARAVTAGQNNSAVFLSLMNHGEKAHALVGASGTAAGSVELHTHVDDGGIIRMRPIAKIEIPASGGVELKPGGHHIMLIDLAKPLSEGDTIHLELRFEDGSQQMLMVPVKNIMGGMKHGSHKDGMHKDASDMKEHKHPM